MVFIGSSVDRQLDCFGILTIANSAAMNIGVHVSFWILILFGYMPWSGTAGSRGGSGFSFLKLLFSVVAAPIYVPTNSVGGFPVLHIITNRSSYLNMQHDRFNFKRSLKLLCGHWRDKSGNIRKISVAKKIKADFQLLSNLFLLIIVNSIVEYLIRKWS